MPDVGSGFEVMQEYLGAGAAVAVRLMVAERDAVMVAHIVELVADAGEQSSAHLHRADVAHIRPPVDPVITQALLQHAHIEYGIVRHEQTA